MTHSDADPEPFYNPTWDWPHPHVRRYRVDVYLCGETAPLEKTVATGWGPAKAACIGAGSVMHANPGRELHDVQVFDIPRDGQLPDDAIGDYWGGVD